MEDKEVNIFETDSYKNCSPYLKAQIEFGHGFLKEMRLQGTDFDYNCGEFISASFEMGQLIGAKYWANMNEVMVEPEAKEYYSDPGNRARLGLEIAGRWMWSPYFSMLSYGEEEPNEAEMSNAVADANAVNQMIERLQNLANELGVQLNIKKISLNGEETVIEKQPEMDLSGFDLDGYLKNILKEGKEDA